LEALEPRALLSAAAEAEVVGRYIFYNNSAFDGNDAAADVADDGAVAVDKVALLPGEPASFANYTSYSRGINGVMVDLAGAADAAAIDVTDFEFRAGRTSDPSAWVDAAVPAEVTVRAADAGSAAIRVTITWPDGAIVNRWLQVTVKATGHTGLTSPDVFFFGNLAGDAADRDGEPSVAQVTANDRALVRDALFSTSPVDGHYDFDRDGVVDAADLVVVRRNIYRRLRVPQSFVGAGMGLAATYFDDPEFAGLTTQRVDPNVAFDWQSASPAEGIEPYLYSVRWTGQVKAEQSETYTFHTTSNDGVRLWVDGRLIIDNWTSHAATHDTGTIDLEAGRKYDVRLEYFQRLGAAVIKLEWSSPSTPRQVIPTDRLYPVFEPVPAPPADDPAHPAPPPVNGDWQMIFRDEFEGDTLNDVWHTAQYWDSDYTLMGNGELQAYDATGVSVSDGMLHLTAREDSKYGVPYVSGLVQSGGDDDNPAKPTFNFLYGYLEVRAKLPAGQGLFPGVWMMPASHDDENGELDVIEMIGSDPTNANFHLHRHGLEEGDDWLGPNLTRTFHTFGVDWQPDHVTWYVDGVERSRITDPALICPEAMYPILNVAVGGDWPGAPDATTVFPATMDVDYLRVWQTPPAP
jgi:beta-glucanase (GH16 family)